MKPTPLESILMEMVNHYRFFRNDPHYHEYIEQKLDEAYILHLTQGKDLVSPRLDKWRTKLGWSVGSWQQISIETGLITPYLMRYDPEDYTIIHYMNFIAASNKGVPENANIRVQLHSGANHNPATST